MKYIIRILTLAHLSLLTPVHAQQVTSTKPPIGVPADARLFDGKWYRVYLENISWDRAKEKCAGVKGQLAIVPDSTTWEFVKNLSPATVWLGATDEETEGVWKWIDGTPFTFTAWLPQNPTNRGGKEHYLSILTHQNKRGWSDAAKNGKTDTRDVVGFICEWKAK